ncbi:hypothetical protein HanRHA438_Chr03g0105191 [Helianthus annuus]|nr:hypothetical protein HanIR_Chr03g0102631 [Helianthus annuus]KAJ0934242.1 hypothetical protein HanRHA438_Chr03g0105191 [Helianthus annuus]
MLFSLLDFIDFFTHYFFTKQNSSSSTNFTQKFDPNVHKPPLYATETQILKKIKENPIFYDHYWNVRRSCGGDHGGKPQGHSRHLTRRGMVLFLSEWW